MSEVISLKFVHTLQTHCFTFPMSSTLEEVLVFSRENVSPCSVLVCAHPRRPYTADELHLGLVDLGLHVNGIVFVEDAVEESLQVYPSRVAQWIYMLLAMLTSFFAKFAALLPTTQEEEAPSHRSRTYFGGTNTMTEEPDE